MKSVILTVLLTVFGTSVPELCARSNQWTSIGPFGGWIQSFAIDPQNPRTLYAGTGSGIFKSTDGGTNWNSINSTFSVLSLAIDPRMPDTLYAGSYGVFKSIDGGLHWSLASSGLPTLNNRPTPYDLQYGPFWDVRALVIDPQNSDVYAGTARGLFKSTNGEQTGMPPHPDCPPFLLGPQGPLLISMFIAWRWIHKIETFYMRSPIPLHTLTIDPFLFPKEYSKRRTVAQVGMP
jgi:hypothetical protein